MFVRPRRCARGLCGCMMYDGAHERVCPCTSYKRVHWAGGALVLSGVLVSLARAFAGDASSVVVTNTCVHGHGDGLGGTRGTRCRRRLLFAAACIPGALSTLVKEAALARQVRGQSRAH